ncbi:MAG TPA: NapC/NirT family cytochrome c [Acidobacteriota bacterium]|nr:NapC/NirT family cytochrome c [Acidobacteriota bacterium]
MHLRSGADNPYIGIVIFVITLIFFLGLILVPIGIYFAKEEVKERFETHISDRLTARRRLLWVLGITTAVNVFIGTQLTYRGVEHMESVQFCGQSCHVMKPEFMAYQFSPHSRIACVDCHVAPGVKGLVESKMSGTRQLIETVLDSAPKPIPTALESGRLVPSKETCEHCHWAEKFAAVRLRVITRFADDEANTPSQSVLLMLVGGSRTKGIHGSHFAPGIEIWFAKVDPKRQKIPVVEYRNVKSGVKRIYKSSDAQGTNQDLEMVQMQCVDCHNRPTHTFELPERAVDRAMMGGFLPSTLPYLKKKSVEILKANYSTSDEAAKKIPSSLGDYYKNTYPDIYQSRKSDIEQAGSMVAKLYGRNVFPELKVTWGTYPNNAGHTDFPGCFRCHDEDHKTADGMTITQDCETCHVPLAMEETSPQILETLGLKKRLDSYLKR